ncbi:MAG TPA: hypothetical protein VNO79_09205 [Actinomycetota bacterium]|nr:hypothetical protein [Actinomycetota bacterium]
MFPPEFPYSILDYGLAAFATLINLAVVWLFVRFLSNHMGRVTKTLEDLVATTRELVEQVFRLSEATRDQLSEFRRDRASIRR